MLLITVRRKQQSPFEVGLLFDFPSVTHLVSKMDLFGDHTIKRTARGGGDQQTSWDELSEWLKLMARCKARSATRQDASKLHSSKANLLPRTCHVSSRKVGNLAFIQIRTLNMHWTHFPDLGWLFGTLQVNWMHYAEIHKCGQKTAGSSALTLSCKACTLSTFTRTGAATLYGHNSLHLR